MVLAPIEHRLHGRLVAAQTARSGARRKECLLDERYRRRQYVAVNVVEQIDQQEQDQGGTRSRQGVASLTWQVRRLG
ncbi:MAG: hypothetical protein NTW03_10800 [Verrucomicrobia bacterium]|nr:hypothetical protein [Verrucomicrobiota bacterium]